IVTGVGGNGFFMQVGPMDPAYTGVDNSGVFVFTGDAPSVMPGNQLDIASAVVNDFFGQTQLTNAEIMVTGNAAIPAPEMVTSAEVTTGGARAAALEGVIVRLMNLTVGDTMPAPGPGDRDPTGEFEVDDMLRVDNFLYEIDPFPMTGEALTELTGILAFRNGNSKVEPRSSDDLIFGGAALQSLAPALSFARAGAGAGPTFPMPLTVRLTRSPAAATTVTLASSAGGLGVMDVVVPAGMREVTVPVTPVTASAAPYTITATLDGRMATADVRVIGAAEVPTTLMIVPGMASVPVNSTAMFDIELGIPAPPGGTTVSLSATAGTVPASIVVPANMLAAPFTFAAGATAGAVTITATAGAANDTAAVTVSDSLAGTLVINEVDYDQPGGDTTEFVELFNRGGGPIDLTGLSVFFINGNNSMEYEAFPLTGTLPGGGYLLIANSAVTAPAGVMVINTADSSIQNGAPDGICLVDTTSNMLIDALSYEGSITAGMAGGSTYNLVEGTALSASDPGAGSLARLPNGTDTDNADSDFALTATPTPGAANMP
ncbi:MAG: lamin tail domain-containing protein, partial [Myxococcota bacterium]